MSNIGTRIIILCWGIGEDEGWKGKMKKQIDGRREIIDDWKGGIY